jgi:hypothetical protein
MAKISFTRLREVVCFRLWRCLVGRKASSGSVTFCLSHYNAPDFLNATLHAIRRHYPDARIIVADASSVWPEFCAAKSVCARYEAELHPLLNCHRHTGLLNYMFRKITTPLAVYLDQDCVLLESLDLLLQKMAEGILLAGPRDEIGITHPNACALYPKLRNGRLRINPQFIHASLMVMNIGQMRPWIGRQPFRWDPAWGPHPLERYYGFTERVRRKAPRAILDLDSEHTGYGMGTVYLYGGRPLAYHNWFSGQVFGQSGKMEGLLDAGWLRTEMKRFLADYWDDKVDFKLASTTHEIGGGANR